MTNAKAADRFDKFEVAFQQLATWCRQRDFSGYDPFDGLNSRFFKATPLAKSRTARLLWTQALKRSPVNLRPLVLIPQQKNSKGIALFALAALADCRRGQTEQKELEARELLDTLVDMRIRGFSGAAWGYNFDWQSRNFFAAAGSPAIVPTAFAARALIEGAQLFSVREYLELSRSACEFILRDLPVSTEGAAAICFGYTPNGPTRIFNASLLAAETLARVSALTGEASLCDQAKLAARFLLRHQNPEGAWSYGLEPGQLWVDNFHTSFVLYSLARIIRDCQLSAEFTSALKRGYQFWRERFFLADGWPKYYDDRLYPADAHAVASAIVTLLEFQNSETDAFAQAERIAAWAIDHLRDPSGFFYYQRRRWFTVKTPFMRWTQAWMLYGLGRLLEEKNRVHNPFDLSAGAKLCQ